ncbi:hypothetical protein Scep_020105 [Stephania cephalantha]|uniref:Uncharacterized protein n=1 Tax=Stephania cephalantha TaxID=152367 RepID=A0AAP0NQI0_9MAGN
MHKEENTTPLAAAGELAEFGQTAQRGRPGAETQRRRLRQGKESANDPGADQRATDQWWRGGAAPWRTDISFGYGGAHDSGTTARDDGEQRWHSFDVLAHKEEEKEK